ncbi:MAG: hypothetical protein J7L59_00865 [Nanoarchaeota archaeon]|nr:hypothetical protein [Nanoarchaeota archaeon]
MKLQNFYPKLKSKDAIKREILRQLKKAQENKPKGGEYDYLLFLDVACKYDINFKEFQEVLFELINEGRVVMNARGFCRLRFTS